jgi:hypothetical protein
VRLGYLNLLNATFTALYHFVHSHYRLWHWLSQHSSARTESLGRLNAYLMCALAKKNVPAYGRFLSDNGHVFRILELESFPETTEENYVLRYGYAERCRHGRIPIAGTVVDESAGSSGTPFNWLRSERELRDVHLNSANWIRFTFPTERLLAINALSIVRPRVHSLGRRLGLHGAFSASTTGLLERDGSALVLTGAGSSAEEILEHGRSLHRVWLSLGKHGLYTHPLSQILDCPATERELAGRLGVTGERRLLSVFRAGRSERPARSSRLR